MKNDVFRDNLARIARAFDNIDASSTELPEFECEKLVINGHDYGEFTENMTKNDFLELDLPDCDFQQFSVQFMARMSDSGDFASEVARQWDEKNGRTPELFRYMMFCLTNKEFRLLNYLEANGSEQIRKRVLALRDSPLKAVKIIRKEFPEEFRELNGDFAMLDEKNIPNRWIGFSVDRDVQKDMVSVCAVCQDSDDLSAVKDAVCVVNACDFFDGQAFGELFDEAWNAYVKNLPLLAMTSAEAEEPPAPAQ